MSSSITHSHIPLLLVVLLLLLLASFLILFSLASVTQPLQGLAVIQPLAVLQALGGMIIVFHTQLAISLWFINIGLKRPAQSVAQALPVHLRGIQSHTNSEIFIIFIDCSPFHFCCVCFRPLVCLSLSLSNLIFILRASHPQSVSDSASGGVFKPHIDQSRPSAKDEEDLQLQLALRMSKEQADEEEKLR